MSDHNYFVRKPIQSVNIFQNKQPLLRHLNIELTERCNNTCMHCYINLPANDFSAKSRELSTEQWKNILNQAADLGALSIRLTGGEPMLREDFQEIYLYARQLGMKVMIFTNARLITQELADFFQKIPPLTKIEVSVYGINEKSYATITKAKNGFIEFQRGLDLLTERKIPFVVRSVLLPPNRSEFTEYETWTAQLPGDQSSQYSLYLILRARRDSQAKNRMIKNMRISPQEGVLIEARDREAYFREIAQFSVRFMYPQGDNLFACGAGESGCVDAYGNYQMCTLLRHPDLTYNLSRGTLHQALAEVFPRFREIRATNPDYLNRCAKCFLKGLCEQCPAKSWTEHGTLDTPVEYLCQVAHEKAYFLGLLSDGEKAWDVSDWRERIHRLSKYSNPITTNSTFVSDESHNSGSICD